MADEQNERRLFFDFFIHEAEEPADLRAADEPKPECYARHTVMKASADLQRNASCTGGSGEATKVTDRAY